MGKAGVGKRGGRTYCSCCCCYYYYYYYSSSSSSFSNQTGRTINSPVLRHAQLQIPRCTTPHCVSNHSRTLTHLALSLCSVFLAATVEHR